MLTLGTVPTVAQAEQLCADYRATETEPRHVIGWEQTPDHNIRVVVHTDIVWEQR
tara:strand:+ start:902 stop:1066 length:165 start_codon:yes stop_codon:yes gene_type:complete